MARIGKMDFGDDLGDEPTIDPLSFTARGSNNNNSQQKDEFGVPIKPTVGGVRGGVNLAPISTGPTVPSTPGGLHRAPVSPAHRQSNAALSNDKATGSSIPLDRDAMMRQLRQYEEKDDANYQLSRAQMREKQNELRREGMERRLMSAEDYTGTAEGARRLQFYENRLALEHEDDLSHQHRTFLKMQEQVRQREEMRRQMEAKIKAEKEREEAEKKKRQEEAEERRRKMLEERRRQEAERKEAEEKAHRERLKKDAMEAEMARLEELRREEEARQEAERKREEEERRKQEEEAARRKRELEAELDKWKQWETAQQEKEREEVSKRKQELAAQQEARKRKLEELRKLQADGPPQVSMEELHQENDKLNKQARIEERARQIAAQQGQGGGGGMRAVGSSNNLKGRGGRGAELVVDDGDDEEEEDGVVTDGQLNEELRGIATLGIEQVREEQQKYMKEKRALNIARRTWFESFREREGRPPTDEESKAEMGEIEDKLTKLDEIVAALQKRSLELAKAAWSTEETEDVKAKEEEGKLKQLKDKEAGFIKEANGVVDTIVTRGPKPASLKTLKDVERERTKCTKAKRKLKVQVKEWSDLFQTLLGRASTAEDKLAMKAVIDALLLIEAHSDALDKRKAEIENPSKPSGPPPSTDDAAGKRRSSMEHAIFSAGGHRDSESAIPTFRRPSLKSTEQPPPSEEKAEAPVATTSMTTTARRRGSKQGSSKPDGSTCSGKTAAASTAAPPEQQERLFTTTATEGGSIKSMRRPSSEVNLSVGLEGAKIGLQSGTSSSGSASATTLSSSSIDERGSKPAVAASSHRAEDGTAVVVGTRRGSSKDVGGTERRPSVTDVSVGANAGVHATGPNAPRGSLSEGRRSSSKTLLSPVAEEQTSKTTVTRPSVSTAGGSSKDAIATMEVKATPKALEQRRPSQSSMTQHLQSPSSTSSSSSGGVGADSKALPPLQQRRPSTKTAEQRPHQFQAAGKAEGGGDKTEDKAAPSKPAVPAKEESSSTKASSSGTGKEELRPLRNVPPPSKDRRRSSEGRQMIAEQLQRQQTGGEAPDTARGGAEKKTTSAKQEASSGGKAVDEQPPAVTKGDGSDKDNNDKNKPTEPPSPAEEEAGKTTESEGDKASAASTATPSSSTESAGKKEEQDQFDRFLTEAAAEEQKEQEQQEQKQGDPAGATAAAAAAEEDDTFDPEIDLPGWHECMSSNMATSAHAAAYLGHYKVLEYLCRYFDVFITDANSRTPLFYSAISDQLACCALLVSIGSDWIDVGDVRGDTPLHAACSANSLQVLDFLVGSEANPNVANFEGLTPAHLCRSAKALKLLHDAGAEVHCIDNRMHMPLFTICADGSAEAVEFLCQRMDKKWICFPDEQGDTALHVASSNGHADCVASICNAAWEWTVLNAVNHKGYTPAHVAGSVSVVQTLYEYGADVFMTTSTNRTPLFTAAAKGLSQIVEFLLQLGGAQHPDAADTPDSNGDTPLHAAACNGHEACVNLLLRYVKFPAAKNSQNLSASDIAREAGMNKISKLIDGHVNLFAKRAPFVPGNSMSFELIQQVKKTYGSRWTRQIDATTGHAYFYDRATGLSQWEKPLDFDEVDAKASNNGGGGGGGGSKKPSIANEVDDPVPMTMERARMLLQEFYRKINPRKLKDVEGILEERADNLRLLFSDLEAKYGVYFFDIEKKRQEAKAMLTAFYQERNPKKVGDVDRLLDERSPDYDKLFQELEAKYKVQIRATGITPTG